MLVGKHDSMWHAPKQICPIFDIFKVRHYRNFGRLVLRAGLAGGGARKAIHTRRSQPVFSAVWLNQCRRLAKDFENRTRNARAFISLVSIRLMLRMPGTSNG